ncbi:hypothetical protein K438DRAFT_1777990 [Mycena galopus ATCC 62051]|nr:hypothetical protein K438DRAFT_1777990 [Mycena galopus ATCC 62051]
MGRVKMENGCLLPYDQGAGRGCTTRRPDTREDQLRRAALGTITPRGATGARSPLLPSTSLAVKTQAGHPVFPPHLAGEEDTCQGINTGISCPSRYAENEAQRHAQAIASATPIPRTGMALMKDRMGVWAEAQPVTTFDEAVNLCHWVHHGNAHTMEYLKWVITGLRDPTVCRSIGGVTLLQYQSQVISRYKGVTEGVRVPRSKVANAGHMPGNGLALHEGPPPETHVAPAKLTQDEEVAMPRADEETDTHGSEPRAYLGVAVPNSDIKTCVHLPESPAKGTRVRTSPPPRSATQFGALLSAAPPLTTDITAWLTLNALAPTQGELKALDRNAFLWKATLIFSVPRYFDHYVTLGQYPPDDLPLEHYPFKTSSLRWSHVVAWFIQHGVLAGSAAVLALELFSCARCNSFLHSADLECQQFSNEWPRSAEDLALTTLAADNMWTSLQHGAIREGVDTFYPIFPAYTIDLGVDENGEIIGGPPTPSAASTTNTEG